MIQPTFNRNMRNPGPWLHLAVSKQLPCSAPRGTYSFTGSTFAVAKATGILWKEACLVSWLGLRGSDQRSSCDLGGSLATAWRSKHFWDPSKKAVILDDFHIFSHQTWVPNMAGKVIAKLQLQAAESSRTCPIRSGGQRSASHSFGKVP